MLFLLLTNAVSTVARRQIEQHLWGDHYSSMKNRNIGESIGELKKQVPNEPEDWIVNIRGGGTFYRREVQILLLSKVWLNKLFRVLFNSFSAMG